VRWIDERGKRRWTWSEAFNQPDSVSLNATLDDATDDRVTVSLGVFPDGITDEGLAGRIVRRFFPAKNVPGNVRQSAPQ
jgi:hypothetical protein